MIFDSATNDNLVLMLDLKDKQGATIVVPMALDLEAGYFRINEVKSIYGRTKSLEAGKNKIIRKPNNEWFVEQVEKGNLKYIDHKKSLEWADQHGLWLPSGYTHRSKVNYQLWTEKYIVCP